MEKQKTFAWWKRALPTSHLTVAASPSRSYTYCQKEASRIDGPAGQCGCEPTSGGIKSSWEQLKEDARRGTDIASLQDRHVGLWAQYPGGFLRVVERFRSEAQTSTDRGGDGGTGDDKRRVLATIYYGPPGTGKSYTVRSIIAGRPHFRVAIGKWFDGYEFERILWIDDFQPGMLQRNVLLNLLDEGDLRVEVKGGTVRVQVDEVYITSNYTITEWFPEKNKKDGLTELARERADALRRRADIWFVGRGEMQLESAADRITMSGNTVPDMVKSNQEKLMAAWLKQKNNEEPT